MIKLLLATFGESGGMVDAACNFCFTLASLIIASVGASARPLFGIVTGGRDIEGIRLLMRRSIMLMVVSLSAFTLWIAHWGKNNAEYEGQKLGSAAYTYKIALHQYTSNGSNRGFGWPMSSTALENTAFSTVED